MANKNLFKAYRGGRAAAADTINKAGGRAYSFNAKHALAQYAATGCLSGTFYASSGEQLEDVLNWTPKIDSTFIAKTAVYARQQGYMKDMPALLCAILAHRDPEALELIFDRVIDNGRMLRNFVQIIRSGVVGRRSFGSRIKRVIQTWITSHSDDAIFKASVGQSPSMADIIKMVHPKPTSVSQDALYAYLLDRTFIKKNLPALVCQFEAYKRDREGETPKVPFQMLTALDLSKSEWRQIAENASWQMTRMNLNTFARHDVFCNQRIIRKIADRLRDPKQIARARVFPYQLMMAYTSATSNVPGKIRNALQDAMEIAIDNVPRMDGRVFVFPDVSGSMHSPVTGYRKGSTSEVRCIDIAALTAAAVLRKNPEAEVIPFESSIVKVTLNPRDSVMTNAKILAKLPAGGTNCSAPLKHLNKRKAKADLIIFVSDNESWMDSQISWQTGKPCTATMTQWKILKTRNPQAKMVCIDIQPNGSTQAKEHDGILNIGGFSDRVFDVIATFANGLHQADHWIDTIEKLEL